MGFENTDSDFDAFLAALAHAPGAPVQSQHLPRALPSATLVAGRYRVERLAGHGGMGEVYLAIDESLDRPVALKLAHARLGPAAERRWQGEARALARLSHPHVVQVFRVGMEESTPFIVMEWVPGKTLAEWVSEGERSWAEVVTLYQQAAEGLAAAHALGIVHRDFKPHNVLLGDDGRVRVADFGLAALDPGDAMTPHGSPGSGDTAGPIGTQGYIAPEVLKGRPADARSDQYSFCAALHEALVGTLPSEDREVHAPGVPHWLTEVVHQGLQTDPTRRHADVASIARALEVKQRVVRRRRTLAVYFGAAATCIGLASGLAAGRQTPCEEAAAELDPVWNAPRRESLRDALVETGSSLANSVTPPLLDAIDTKATEWASQRTSVCEGRPVDTPPQLECLTRVRLQLEATLEVLEQPDRETVMRARELVATIDSPADCDSDRSANAALASEDEQTLQRAIAEVNALRVSGRALEARDRASDLSFGTASSSQLVAPALLARGLAYAEADGQGSGVEDLQSAYWSATARHQDMLAAEASRSVVRYVVTGPSSWDEAERWARLALASERRLGLEAPSWKLLRARAKAARGAQRFEPARHDYEAALEAAKDASATQRVDLLNSLSGLLGGEYRLDDALRRAREAVALAEESLPYDSPAYASALISVGKALEQHGEYAEAREAFREALEIRRRIFDPSSTQVTEALSFLAGTLARAGQLEDALALQDEALDLATARQPPDPIEVANNLTVKGRVLFDLGRFDEARTTLERAASAHEDANGEVGLERAYALMLLGISLLELRDFEGDYEAQTRALDVLRQVVSPDSPQIAGALANRATALLMLERPDDASDDLETAAEILRLAGEERGILASMVLAMQAEAQAQRGDMDEAAALALEALELDRELSPEPHAELVRAYSTAADTLMLAGKLDDAERVVLEGLATLDALEPMDHLRGKLALDLAKIALRRGDRASLRQRCRTGKAGLQAAWAREEVAAWCEAQGISTD